MSSARILTALTAGWWPDYLLLVVRLLVFARSRGLCGNAVAPRGHPPLGTLCVRCLLGVPNGHRTAFPRPNLRHMESSAGAILKHALNTNLADRKSLFKVACTADAFQVRADWPSGKGRANEHTTLQLPTLSRKAGHRVLSALAGDAHLHSPTVCIDNPFRLKCSIPTQICR